ncbi:MAG: hypothetical protein J0I17_08965 ['Candidatus Kapabacteria' thiocyanatum]|uniref:HTH luxR-type domain-containing protein n=1 Tax=Candidatus Kapaibacterium thiocyanatum TaxID=1895771 RepID=A0A1M3KZ13_9BACT|nr:hypothetical protein ['Candidatus Kapabacteria' thiocyanatum]OJX57758.1 MAG: hypothetical protein BGO89_07250 ['Candidatus Kapabacteria' thiocyanatum]
MNTDHMQQVQALLLREVQYTSMLHRIRETLDHLHPRLDPTDAGQVSTLSSSIDTLLDDTETRREFEHVFAAMHGTFLSDLAKDFPTITVAEMRLCAFLRLPLSSKDIADIFHCSVRSIEKHRERLRKKFGLLPGESLTTFLTARGQ